MDKLVREWVKKAEGDFNSALREYRARKNPNYDAAGFHAQQAVEKFFKAFLQQNNITFQKTHDLLALMELFTNKLPEMELHRSALAFLNQFSVNFRYPGETTSKKQAKETIKIIKELIPLIRNKLR